MPDIVQEFTVKAPQRAVFEAVSTPEGLDRWWTKSASGTAKDGAEFTLGFGPGYDWRARVTRYVPDAAFELLLTDAHADWLGTRVGCELERESDSVTRVHFHHTGWPEGNEHWRVSCYCWAMYLRLLRRSVEHGEFVPYEQRLDV